MKNAMLSSHRCPRHGGREAGGTRRIPQSHIWPRGAQKRVTGLLDRANSSPCSGVPTSTPCQLGKGQQQKCPRGVGVGGQLVCMEEVELGGGWAGSPRGQSQLPYMQLGVLSIYPILENILLIMNYIVIIYHSTKCCIVHSYTLKLVKRSCIYTHI